MSVYPRQAHNAIEKVDQLTQRGQDSIRIAMQISRSLSHGVIAEGNLLSSRFFLAISVKRITLQVVVTNAKGSV